jgi:hypothetical protein
MHILIVLFAAHAVLELWLVPNQRAADALTPCDETQSAPPGLRLPGIMALITLLAFWDFRGIAAGILVFIGYTVIRWLRWTWHRYSYWHYLGEHSASGLLLLVVVGGLAGTSSGWLVALLPDPALQLLAGITGLLVMWFAGATTVGLLVTELNFQPSSGIPDAGRLIGQLERTLILFLVIAGVPSGIGLLVAAKSILRFGEVKEPENREMAEYVLIGTLASFAFAVPAAYGIAELIHWAQ